jgi:hypothetical protein
VADAVLVAQRGKGGRIVVEKDTYERLVADYDGLEVCWICGSKPKTRRLHIDHDHKTLKIRGLLCYPCNRRLTKGTTEKWLRNALLYMKVYG